MRTVGAGQIVRFVAVAALAAMLALQVVRTALVSIPYGDRPGVAARLWPSHPTIVLDRNMAEIGAAAARGRGVTPETLAQVRDFARKAPLSADPFLVEGAMAQTEGRDAALLFLEARARNSRSRGARYFLADHYFRSGKISRGLIEMAALSRLEPGAAAPFVPALVAYAREPRAVPQLKAFFRAVPAVEPSVLSLLADDVENVDLVLSLASAPSAAPAPEWQRKVVARLAESGQYGKAHAVWARLSGVRAPPLLFNPGFDDLAAPPPFNWAIAETGDGAAAPAEGGSLQVLYYGRREAVLASQLLLLPTGPYALSMEVSNEGEADGLRWTVRCASRDQRLLSLPLRQRIGRFTVPPGNCSAQWLELRGSPGDFPRTAELTIRKLQLARETRP